jgi:hypothetical protein
MFEFRKMGGGVRKVELLNWNLGYQSSLIITTEDNCNNSLLIAQYITSKFGFIKSVLYIPIM